MGMNGGNLGGKDPAEEWRAIPGVEGRYDVSNRGEVRSYFVRGGQGSISTVPRLLLKQKVDREGYREVTLVRPDRKPWHARVHRLVMLAFVGPCPDGMEVDHINADRADNQLTNLRYVTPAVNMTATVGRPRKEHAPHPRPVTSALNVDEARRMREAGASITAIARHFGVSWNTAHRLFVPRSDRRVPSW
jgi:hypothetical protein